MVRRILYLALIFLLFINTALAQENGYKITYTIIVTNNGAATWHVEYRTPLVSKDDFDAFENYTMQLKSVHLEEFRQLMVKSVSEAANATSRKMIAGGFTGDAEVQTAPTGTYGVVHYSFTWTNFAKIDSDQKMNIGDVFVGGLYLSKDNTLIMQYPSGYTLEKVMPQPDQISDGLLWYGLRSFQAGEPEITLIKTSTPWMQYVFIIFIVLLAAGIFSYIYKIRGKKEEKLVKNAKDDITEASTESITESELMDLEDRIIKLLKEKGGSMYQSNIGKLLGLPKSTVSSALNELHNKKVIQKIKKGRENLIRLI